MHRFLSLRHSGLLLLFFFALSLFAYLHATHSFNQQLRAYIQHNVIEQTDKAELYSFNDATTQSYLVKEITRNLASLCPEDFFHILGDCSAQIVTFKGLDYSSAAHAHYTMDFYQASDSSHPLLQVGVFYRVHWGYLLGAQGLLALLAVLLLALIPKPISQARAIWISVLKEWEVNEKQALKLTRTLGDYPLAGAARLRDLWSVAQKTGATISPETALVLAAHPRVMTLNVSQLNWLLVGLDKYPQALDTALAIAEHRDQLVFVPATRSIRIHGLDIPFADTPFFYFYWYALWRLSSDEGWYTNPAQNRPDQTNSHTLHALFGKYGGHAKAASELQEKGVRAKTLDQNRSKIKEELGRHIGEELAHPYLFDVQRDARTARFKYRISLAPEFIQVEPDDLKLFCEHNAPELTI